MLLPSSALFTSQTHTEFSWLPSNWKSTIFTGLHCWTIDNTIVSYLCLAGVYGANNKLEKVTWKMYLLHFV